MKLSLDAPWFDQHHKNAEGSQLQAQGIAQSFQCELGGRVCAVDRGDSRGRSFKVVAGGWSGIQPENNNHKTEMAINALMYFGIIFLLPRFKRI